MSRSLYPTALACPTCTDAKNGCCCGCGQPISDVDQTLQEDPYASEIRDDKRLHLQCSECFKKSLYET